MKILTDWHPTNIKPVRKGYYLIRYYDDTHAGTLRYWNGAAFEHHSDYPIYRQDWLEWRGLAFDPDPSRCVIDMLDGSRIDGYFISSEGGSYD